MELIIAEKPSVAKSIAAVLGVNGNKGKYLENNRYCITWCVGHLVELAPPLAYDPKYKSWNYADLPILPERWQYQVSKGKEDQFKTVKELMNRDDVTAVICATDAGREGELIFRLVYDKAGCKKPIKRLWISSMEDAAILEGFHNLKDGSNYEALNDAAVCRSQADWLIGMNATRLFTIVYKSQGSLSVGRVQTPTLAMIVERDEQIKNFIKQLYYMNHIDCDGMDAVGERIDDKDKAIVIRDATDQQEARVVSVEKTTKNINPPKLYDLTTLQREVFRTFGYTSEQTLNIAQKLYEIKLATYPRTDSQYITTDMGETVRELVPLLRNTLSFVADKTAPVNIDKITNNKKVSDHHAIIPTKQIQNSEAVARLAPEELNVLNMIAIRVVCATDQPHQYSETVIKLDSEGYIFTAKGKTILDNGWKTLETDYKKTLKTGNTEKEKEAQVLPDVKKYDVFKCVKASISEHVTSPPKHYTEDTLLSAMETAGNNFIEEDIDKKGIGTPATRASIIEKIIKSGFVERKNKSLISTQKGADLISILPEDVKSPKMTAEWEDKLSLMEKGAVSKVTFMGDIVELTRRLVAENSQPMSGKNFTMERESIGKCPRCGCDIYENPKYKNYYCSNKECKFVLWENTKFFAEKKKKLTKKMVQDFLLKGQTKVTGLYSPKKDTKYDAVIVMKEVPKADGSGDVWINFEHDFSQQTKKKSSGRKSAGVRR